MKKSFKVQRMAEKDRNMLRKLKGIYLKGAEIKGRDQNFVKCSGRVTENFNDS